jgi:hypothetical protein
MGGNALHRLISIVHPGYSIYILAHEAPRH